MKSKFTDDARGGANNAIRAINPPSEHEGYYVVADGRIYAVCKFYGRACELAGRVGGFVTTHAASRKAGYTNSITPIKTK